MPISHIPLNEINESHLQALVDSNEREDRKIEYKREWRIANDLDRRELLLDVASFANAGGGDLLYGVEEGTDNQRGFPVKLVGVVGISIDVEERRLHDLLKQWISPRLVGTTCRLVPIMSGASVLVVRIRPGIRPPHVVKHGSVPRFVSRHTSGRFDLDVDELRRAFVDSEVAVTRVSDFRLDRVDRIARRDTGENLETGAGVVLHVIPFQPWESFDFEKIEAISREHTLPLLAFGTYGIFSPPEIRLDGCIMTADAPNGDVLGYVQIFRNGALEAWSWRNRSPVSEHFATSYEREILSKFPGYIHTLGRLGIPPPYFVTLSLLDVKNRMLWPGRGRPIQHDNLMLPGHVMETEATPSFQVLKPLYDLAWNASGRLASENYDPAGNDRGL